MHNNIMQVNPSRITLRLDKANNQTSGTDIFSAGSVSQLTSQTIYPQDVFAPADLTVIPYDDGNSTPGLFKVTITDPADMSVGSYNYTLQVVDPESGIRTPLPVNVSVVNESGQPGNPTDPGTPPDDFEALYFPRYKGEFQDVEGTAYHFTIRQRGYDGTVQDIGGRASLSYQKRDNYFTPILAASLQLDLEATEAVTLQDLYSEEENTFTVDLYRGEDILFTGFIKPDGIYENWVVDRWELSIDAVDGLAYLKNLSFVDDNAISFTGNMSVIGVIASCLRRTGLSLPINVFCQLERGQTIAENILSNTVVKTERFFQNDSSSDPMDCDAVLRSTLQVFNLTLMQHRGEWFVFREIDANRPALKFTKYAADGSIFPPPNRFNELDIRDAIGSHIKGAVKFHCHGDQQKSARASIQAFRLYYKYGLAAAIMRNETFQMGAGLNSDGWTIKQFQRSNADRVKRNDNGYGFNVSLGWQAANQWITETVDPVFDILHFNQTVYVSKDTRLKFRARWHGVITQRVYLPITIKVGNFFLVEGVGWTTTPGLAATVSSDDLDGELTWEADSPLISEDGQLLMSIGFRAVAKGLSSRVQKVRLSFDEFSVKPSSTNYKGRIYTGQRKQRVSSVTKPDLTVYNGDSRADLFVGTLYDPNGQTATESWSRVGMTENKEVLSINVEDNLRIAPRTMLIFSGSVYGYVSPLSVISIDGIPGKFQPMEWTFDAVSNVTKLQLREFEDAAMTDFTIEDVPDVGQETKVTIRS